MEKRIGRLSILVGVLPLAVAVLILGLAPEAEIYNATQIVRLHRLAIGLIVFGGFGLYLVVIGSARLSRVLRGLTLSQEQSTCVIFKPGRTIGSDPISMNDAARQRSALRAVA